MTVRLLRGDCREVLKTLPDQSVHTCVTSPPYWGLRDYKLPPSVWGGDALCVHQWGDSIRDTSKGSGFQGKNGKRCDRTFPEQRETLRERGNVCICGAWRGCLGLEPDYQMFVEHMVEVFREVRRVLRDDGTLWLNLGDTYASGKGTCFNPGGNTSSFNVHLKEQNVHPLDRGNRSTLAAVGLKPKDLIGVPWRVAFALQADGWYLRQDIVWAKPNPMPESVTDRCTKAHEYLFLLTKQERYYFDQDGISEDASANTHPRRANNGWKTPDGWDTTSGTGGHGSFHRDGREAGHVDYVRKRKGGGNKSHKGTQAYNDGQTEHRTKAGLVEYSRKMAEPGSGIKNNDSMDAALAIMPEKRNKRSVWTVATKAFKEAHFATFPPALIEPCILAGCPEGGTVLDPFGGAGTTGLVADRLGRNAILIELNPDYAAMAGRRIKSDAGMFAEIAAE